MIPNSHLDQEVAPACQKEQLELETEAKEENLDEEERKISLEIKYENVVKDMQSSTSD